MITWEEESLFTPKLYLILYTKDKTFRSLMNSLCKLDPDAEYEYTDGKNTFRFANKIDYDKYTFVKKVYPEVISNKTANLCGLDWGFAREIVDVDLRDDIGWYIKIAYREMSIESLNEVVKHLNSFGFLVKILRETEYTKYEEMDVNEYRPL